MAEVTLTDDEATSGGLPPVCIRCGAPADCLRQRAYSEKPVILPFCHNHRVNWPFWTLWVGIGLFFLAEIGWCSGIYQFVLAQSPPGKHNIPVFVAALVGCVLILILTTVVIKLAYWNAIGVRFAPNRHWKVFGVAPEFVEALAKGRQSVPDNPDDQARGFLREQFPYQDVRVNVLRPLPALCLRCGAPATVWKNERF